MKYSTKAIDLEFGDLSTLLQEKLCIECPFSFLRHVTSGSSGSEIFIFKDEVSGKKYAIKFAKNPRVPFIQESQNRDTLKKIIGKHVPDIYWVGTYKGYEVMISECVGLYTLQELILSGEMDSSVLLGIWKDVVSKTKDMWLRTAHPGYSHNGNPRKPLERFNRIKEGVIRFELDGLKLGEHINKKVIVNGAEYSSLSDIFEYVSTVETPLFGVVCHGDPQPSNIVVGDELDWYYVDFEWSSCEHDWRIMFSHLYGWWMCHNLTIDQPQTILFEADSIRINYSATLDISISQYMEQAVGILDSLTPSNHDIDDINKYLITLLFGDLRFVSMWGRTDVAGILIGEAAKIHHYSVSNREIDSATNSRLFKFNLKQNVSRIS